MLRINPYLTAAFFLWDVFDAYKMYQQGREPMPDFAALGFTLKCKLPWQPAPTPPFPAPGFGHRHEAAGGPSCTLGAFVPMGPSGWPTATQASRRSISIGPLMNTAGTRGTTAEVWTRPSALPGGTPIPFTPAMPPAILPYPDAAPAPAPLPVKLIPYRPNSPYYEAGNYPPGAKPAPRPSGRPAPSYARKPPSGVRERKTRNPFVGAGLAALGFLHGLSEGVDAIESIYKALPKDIRDKDYGPATVGMVNAIVANADKIDWWQAIQNLAANHLEDAVVGALAGILDKFGIGMGVNNQPYLKRQFGSSGNLSPHFGRKP